MLTLTQQHRYTLYLEHRSLAKVAALEGVSRECIRLTLESMPKDTQEYKTYKAIASQSKGGRPPQYSDRKEQRRVNMQNWRAKQKFEAG